MLRMMNKQVLMVTIWVVTMLIFLLLLLYQYGIKILIIVVMNREGLEEDASLLLSCSVTTLTMGLRVDVLDEYVIIVFVSLLGDCIPILSFQPIESKSFSSLSRLSFPVSSLLMSNSEALCNTMLMMKITMTGIMFQIPI